MKTIDKRIFKALEETKEIDCFRSVKELTPLIYSLAISTIGLEIASKGLYKI